MIFLKWKCQTGSGNILFLRQSLCIYFQARKPKPDLIGMKEAILKEISLEEQEKNNTDPTPESGRLTEDNCVVIHLLSSSSDSTVVLFTFA